MAMKIAKEESSSAHKYLLPKKEITEAEFLTLLSNSGEQQIIKSQHDHPISFASDNNNPKSRANEEYSYETNSNQYENNAMPSFTRNSPQNDKVIPLQKDQGEHVLRKKTKDEFSNAISQYKNQVESSIKNERQMMELELNQKWKDNCDDLLYECKAKERDQKEKLLEDKMKEKLEQQVKKDLCKTEYNNVVEKIRKEVQEDIAKDFIQKKQREIEAMKRKIEFSTQSKLIEIEKGMIQKYKEEFDKEKKMIVDEKEKDIKTIYEEKLIAMKEKAKKDLTEKYYLMNNELMRDLDEIKHKYEEQKVNEMKRMAKLNEMQASCIQEEIVHKEKHQEINNVLTACKQTDSSRQMTTKEFRQQFQQPPQQIMRKSNSKSNLSSNPLNNNNNNTSNYIQIPTNNDRSVNLFEVNNRIRYTSPKNDSVPINTNNNNRGEYNHFLSKKLID